MSAKGGEKHRALLIAAIHPFRPFLRSQNPEPTGFPRVLPSSRGASLSPFFSVRFPVLHYSDSFALLTGEVSS